MTHCAVRWPRGKMHGISRVLIYARCAHTKMTSTIWKWLPFENGCSSSLSLSLSGEQKFVIEQIIITLCVQIAMHLAQTTTNDNGIFVRLARRASNGTKNSWKIVEKHFSSDSWCANMRAMAIILSNVVAKHKLLRKMKQKTKKTNCLTK